VSWKSFQIGDASKRVVRNNTPLTHKDQAKLQCVGGIQTGNLVANMIGGIDLPGKTETEWLISNA
jgi:hypothetical protein